MYKLIKWYRLIVFVFILSVVLSSCQSTDLVTDSRDEIHMTVYQFLESIQSGRLAQDGYLSDYVADTSFLDLEFMDARAEAIFTLGMLKMEYEVTNVRHSALKEHARCDVIIKTIDIMSMLESVNHSYSEEEWQTLLNGDLLTVAREITLDVYYNDNEASWVIKDTQELAAFLKEPYTQIFFSIETPQEIAEMFMDALSRGDFDLVCMLSEDHYYEGDFIDFRFIGSRKLFEYAFERMSFELTREYIREDEAYIYFDVVMPDYMGAHTNVSKDVKFVANEAQDYLLRYFRDDYYMFADIRPEFDAYMSVVLERIYDEITRMDQDAHMEIEVALYYDSQKQDWYVKSVSNVFTVLGDIAYRYDPIEVMSSSELRILFELAIDTLYKAGKISQSEHDSFMSEFAQIETDFEAVSYSAEDLKAEIYEVNWYDWVIMDYVNEYNVYTDCLNIDIVFYEYLPGLVLECDFYSKNGEQFLGTETSRLFSEEKPFVEFIFYNPKNEFFLSDTYVAVIRTTEGDIVAESSITLS